MRWRLSNSAVCWIMLPCSHWRSRHSSLSDRTEELPSGQTLAHIVSWHGGASKWHPVFRLWNPTFLKNGDAERHEQFGYSPPKLAVVSSFIRKASIADELTLLVGSRGRWWFNLYDKSQSDTTDRTEGHWRTVPDQIVLPVTLCYSGTIFLCGTLYA